VVSVIYFVCYGISKVGWIGVRSSFWFWLPVYKFTSLGTH